MICLHLVACNAVYWLQILQKHGISAPTWGKRYRANIPAGAQGSDHHDKPISDSESDSDSDSNDEELENKPDSDDTEVFDVFDLLD